MDYNTQRMVSILTYRRPHNDPTVQLFIDDVLKNYAFTTLTSPTGEPLALVLAQGTSETLFSCHLDTVHRTGGRQTLGWDTETGLFYKPDSSDDQCLGADDGAGIWLLLEMIDAGVPGVYALHYGEERGGVGSSGLAEHHADWLKSFKRAVAFDRRGTTSVITHQGWGRCCSDTFGDALADALNAVSGLRMRTDDTGIFTDTANYVELIPECTNISCGYDAEHTKGEMLDFEWLCALRDAVVQVNWEALPTDRVAERLEPTGYWGQAQWSKYDDADSLSEMRYSEVLKWVKHNVRDPEFIADTLYEALSRMYDAENLDTYPTEEVGEDDELPTVWGKPEYDDGLDFGVR